MPKTSDIVWEDFFYYDETSPSGIRWKVDRFNGLNHAKKFRSVGDVAGTVTKDKGWRINFGEPFAVSRIIYEMVHKIRLKSDELIDHIDGNRANNVISNLRIVDVYINNRNLKMSHDNTSGVVGVNRQADARGSWYWVATVYKLGGGRIRKCFSEVKYGCNEAFEMAVAIRNKLIEELNEQGAGYSERHGK